MVFETATSANPGSLGNPQDSRLIDRPHVEMPKKIPMDRFEPPTHG